MTVNRVTKVVGEVVTANEPEARVTLLAGEVLTQSNPNLRVSQVVGEVVYATDPPNRVSLIALEVIAKLATAKIMQTSVEVIQDINPVNSETLKLCLPFDETLTEAFTIDESPSNHPIDMTTELPTIRSDPNGFDDKFGGGAVELGAGGDFVRVLLPQPDLNFDGDFTIEFWLFRIAPGAQEDVMGQWPENADHPSPGTDLSWRIKLFGPQLHFEWTSDGATINTEVAFHDVAVEEWEHLAFENFGGIFTIYSNGIPVYNTASFVPIHRSVEDLLIGKADRYGTGGDGACDCNIDELKIVVGEATFQAPFSTPSASIDCVTVIPEISWEPGNLGDQFECESSEFQIIVTGLETVIGIQSFTASGLPEGMVIDSNGNIFGTLPVHTAPPATQNYSFQVTFFVGGTAFLGPSTFSFDVKDRFADDILQVTTPAFFEDEDRTAWKIHLLGLISNDDQFLPAGDDFGISLTPRLFIMDGLTEDDLTAYQTAMAPYDPAIRSRVIFETLKVGTNGRFDVLYYSIEDRGSDILTFENPLRDTGPGGREEPIADQTPSPILPLSINNIRSRLETTVGFDSQYGQELLPDWLPTYEPMVIAAFVKAGRGQALVDKFDGDAFHHVFKGRTIVLDRLDIRRCSTDWPQNGERRLTIKFDDVV